MKRDGVLYVQGDGAGQMVIGGEWEVGRMDDAVVYGNKEQFINVKKAFFREHESKTSRQ